MKLNRQLQKKILQALQEVYPDSLLVAALPEFQQGREFMGNLFYLQEHGLIEGGDIREPGQCRSMVDAQITRDGLDFLENDGGLGAILAMTSVVIESEDMIRSITAGLKRSKLDDGKQLVILQSVAEMNIDSLKDLFFVLAEKGAEQDILQALESVDYAF